MPLSGRSRAFSSSLTCRWGHRRQGHCHHQSLYLHWRRPRLPRGHLGQGEEKDEGSRLQSGCQGNGHRGPSPDRGRTPTGRRREVGARPATTSNYYQSGQFDGALRYFVSRFCPLVELCVRQPEFVICWGSQGGEWQHWTIKLDAVQCSARS